MVAHTAARSDSSPMYAQSQKRLQNGLPQIVSPSTTYDSLYRYVHGRLYASESWRMSWILCPSHPDGTVHQSWLPATPTISLAGTRSSQSLNGPNANCSPPTSPA